MSVDLSCFNSPRFNESGHKIRVDSSIKNPISASIEKAPINSTIIVPSGEYFDNIVINKRIMLAGEGKVTITSFSGGDTMIIDTKEAFVQNIQITSGNSQGATAINIRSGQAVLVQCTVSAISVPAVLVNKNSIGYLTGCSLVSQDSPCIKLDFDSKIDANRSVFTGSYHNGVVLGGRSVIRMVECLITNCERGGIVSIDESVFFIDKTQISQNGGHGLETTSTKECVLQQSVISNQSKGAGIMCYGNSRLNVINCSVSSCLSCISVEESAYANLDSCQISNAGDFSMVSALNGGKIRIQGGKLEGTCKCALVSANASIIEANELRIENIVGTAAACYGKSSLILKSTSISSVTQGGIEAHNLSRLFIENSALESIGTIGLHIKDSVSCECSNLTISTCNIVCCLFLNNQEDASFDNCHFQASSGNGLNLKNSKPSFTSCHFHHNAFAGVEVKSSDSSPTFSRCTFFQNAVIGINIQDGAQPLFERCSFSQNIGSGVSIQASMPTFNDCHFNENGQMGMCAFDKTTAVFNNCVFQKNVSLGSQIENEGTIVTYKGCEFSNHENYNAVILNDKCFSSFHQCSFHHNGESHIEARASSRLKMVDCEAYQSTKGLGILIHDSAFADIYQTRVHDESQAGIIIAQGGDVRISESDIYSCGATGVYMLEGSNGEIKKNRIHHNGVCGIQILAGTPQIIENTIEDHPGFGIHIAGSASPIISANIFRNNIQSNVNRA